MRVEFLKTFYQDLDDINSGAVKARILALIEQVEQLTTLRQVPNLKKLSGFQTAYRIRVGDYRVGIFVQGDLVQFARVKNRKDIYRIFP
ncbi:MAG: type II toxin-antitoxin system RelE family toxin [Cyclobacteriaceae bacterium]|jgi:mRNA interferase RelE/StbE